MAMKRSFMYSLDWKVSITARRPSRWIGFSNTFLATDSSDRSILFIRIEKNL